MTGDENGAKKEKDRREWVTARRRGRKQEMLGKRKRRKGRRE